jgi:ligand-binding SRPBCC domain-containing protein
MPRIELQTYIAAPVERVFDLSRSIDLHKLSTRGTDEEAIGGGRTSGLIELNETVTWRAKHFGVYQKLTVVIDRFERPKFFNDVMVRVAFDQMQHLHQFEAHGNGTLMSDTFEFRSPLGWIGKLVDKLVLKKYMKRFLVVRNAEIKRIAESDAWKELLPK